MRRVLYIAYYFPPAGGPGVQRTLKFVRYLPDHGWEPTVVTVRADRAAWPATDPSMLAEVPDAVEVVRTHAWDPYAAYARLKGRSKADSVGVGFADPEAPGLFEQVARFIRANVFLPDARVGWVPFARRAVARLMREQQFDALITTGPPHSTHLVGRWAADRFGLPWLADFRDPWADLSYYDQLPFLPWSRALDARQEQRTLNRAEALVTVSRAVAELLSGRTATPVHVIPNGYDPEDFRGVLPVRGDGFRVVYVGTLTEAQNPHALWETLVALRAGGRDVRLHLVGRVDAAVRNSLMASGLAPDDADRDDSPVRITPYVPHREAVAHMLGADLLLLCVPRTAESEGILTGKLFEYLAAGRPLLAMGPAVSDAARIIREAGAGVMVEYSDRAGAAHCVESRYHAWKAGTAPDGPNPDYLHQYTRSALAGQLALTLQSLVPDSDA